MEFKGSKSPWDVEGKFVYCDDSLGSAVCQFDLDYIKKEQQKANAKLISKAPEMLEMLNEILADKDWKEDIDFNKIKQLIKEATSV